MGERRLTGVLSTPTMSLTPASAGADAKWHQDNGFYLATGIQQMLMPACVMLVRNQIEMAQ